jgi:hypothetical protein
MTTAMHGAEIATEIGGKAVEAIAAYADASQKLLRELVDLSTTTAKEGVRLYAELQSAAVEAVRGGQAGFLGGHGALQDAPRDPMGACQKALLDSVESAQRTFKLVEGNAQAITRSAERLQITAEQTTKEIQATFGQLAGRVKSLWI